jgi:hypothetical protein
MHIYRTTEAIRMAADTHPDPELRHLLTLRIQSLEAFDDLPDDLAYLLQVVVLQAGESVADLQGFMGFSIGHCRSTEVAFDTDGFCPAWEVIEAHGRWFELTFVLSDDGAGVVVFVPDTAAAPLLALCRRYAVPSQP